MKSHSTLNMITTALAELTMFWTLFTATMALFKSLADTQAFLDANPLFILGATVVLIIINHLILLKERPLLLVIIIEAVLAGLTSYAVCRLTGNLAAAFLIFQAVTFLVTMIIHTRRELGNFSEKTPLLELQIVLVLTCFTLWFSAEAESNTPWFPYLVASIFILMLGILVDKASGVHAEGRKKRSLKDGGIIAVIIALAAAVALLAARFVGPIGEILGSIFDKFAAVCTFFGNILGAVFTFLFYHNRADLGGGMASVEGSSQEAEVLIEQTERNFNLFEYIFFAVVFIIIASAVVALIRFLLSKIVGVKVTIKKRKTGELQIDGNLFQKIRAYIAYALKMRKARSIIRRNPDSIAALLIRLENECSHSDELRRKDSDTVRDFIGRIIDSLKDRDAADMAASFENFLKAAENACYSRQGNLISVFNDASTIKAFSLKANFEEKP